MERLLGIIKILRKGEKRLLRHLYSATTNGEERLRLELFNLIDAGTVKTDSAAIKALGSKQSASSYSHLKARLREDILNVLLLQESPKRIAQANRAATFECRKKLAQAYVLIFRGAFKEAVIIIDSVKPLAEKYELSAELVLFNQLIREAVHLIKDEKHLSQINADIKFNRDRWLDILRAEELALTMTVPQLLVGKSTNDTVGIDEVLIDELRVLYEKNRSARIGVWYYLAFIEHANANARYTSAIRAGHEFIKLVKMSPSIRSRNDVAGSNQMLGTAYLNIRDYANAAIHFATADQNFPMAGNNRIMNFELLFRAQIGMGDNNGAGATVNEAINHARAKAKAATLPRWHYFHACQMFLTGGMEDAFRMLNQDGYLTKQRDEWNVQYRLLEIMIMTEQKDEEWIDFRIQTLRKFLTRNRKLGTLRVKANIEVLNAILHQGLEFDTFGKKAEESLRLCLEEGSGYEWSPEGAEVVRIDHWVQSKRSRLPTKKRQIR